MIFAVESCEIFFLPAVAGAEAGSSPGAEEGNLHQLVLHHIGAALLLEKVKLGTVLIIICRICVMLPGYCGCCPG